MTDKVKVRFLKDYKGGPNPENCPKEGDVAYIKKNDEGLKYFLEQKIVEVLEIPNQIDKITEVTKESTGETPIDPETEQKLKEKDEKSDDTTDLNSESKETETLVKNITEKNGNQHNPIEEDDICTGYTPLPPKNKAKAVETTNEESPEVKHLFCSNCRAKVPIEAINDPHNRVCPNCGKEATFVNSLQALDRIDRKTKNIEKQRETWPDKTIDQIVQDYRKKYGLNVLPADRGKKFPNLESYTEYKTEWPLDEQVEKWLKEGKYQNIFSLLGAISNNITEIDVDVPDARLADIFSDVKDAKKKVLIQKSSMNKKKIYCRGETIGEYEDLEVSNKEYTMANGKKSTPHVEYAGENRGTILPPSIHPDTKEEYIWLNLDENGNLPELEIIDTKKLFYTIVERLRKTYDYKEEEKPEETEGKTASDNKKEKIRFCFKKSCENGDKWNKKAGHDFRTATACELIEGDYTNDEMLNFFKAHDGKSGESYDKKYTKKQVEGIRRKKLNPWNCDTLRKRCGGIVEKYCNECSENKKIEPEETKPSIDLTSEIKQNTNALITIGSTCVQCLMLDRCPLQRKKVDKNCIVCTHASIRNLAEKPPEIEGIIPDCLKTIMKGGLAGKDLVRKLETLVNWYRFRKNLNTLETKSILREWNRRNKEPLDAVLLNEEINALLKDPEMREWGCDTWRLMQLCPYVDKKHCWYLSQYRITIEADVDLDIPMPPEEIIEIEENLTFDNSFIGRYEYYQDLRCDAPRVFATHLSIQMLGHIIGYESLNMTQPDEMHHNVFLFLIGPSGKARKTTSQNIAKKVYPRETKMPDGFSPEGFLKELSQHPQAMAWLGEMSQLLRGIKQGGQMAKFMEITNELHGCPEDYKKRLAADKNSFVIEKPYLSQNTTCTENSLFPYLTIEVVHGGFLARYLPVWGISKRRKRGKLPEEAKKLKPIWKEALQNLYQLCQEDHIQFEFTENAYDVLDEICKDLDESAYYDEIRPFVTRVEDYLIVYADIIRLSDILGFIGLENISKMNTLTNLTNITNLTNLTNLTSNNVISPDKNSNKMVITPIDQNDSDFYGFSLRAQSLRVSLVSLKKEVKKALVSSVVQTNKEIHDNPANPQILKENTKNKKNEETGAPFSKEKGEVPNNLSGTAIPFSMEKGNLPKISEDIQKVQENTQNPDFSIQQAFDDETSSGSIIVAVDGSYIERAWEILAPCLDFAKILVRYLEEDTKVAKLEAVLERYAPINQTQAMQLAHLTSKDYHEAQLSLEEREVAFHLVVEHVGRGRDLTVLCTREKIETKRCKKCHYHCIKTHRDPQLEALSKRERQTLKQEKKEKLKQRSPKDLKISLAVSKEVRERQSALIQAVDIQRLKDFFTACKGADNRVSSGALVGFIKHQLNKVPAERYLSILTEKGAITRHDEDRFGFTWEDKKPSSQVEKEEIAKLGDTPVSSKSEEMIGGKTFSERGDHDYILVQTLEELEKVLDLLSTKKKIVIDTETTSLDISKLELVGISLCADPGKAYYIPLAHKITFSLEEGKTLKNLPKKETFELLSQKILRDSNIGKIGQNLKFDLEVLHKEGLDINYISFDTMLASYVINSNNTKKLEDLAKRYCNYEMQSISTLIGKGLKQKSFADVSIEDATFYSCEDADYTLRVANVLKKKLNEEDYKDVFSKIEMPLLKVLANMEETGVKINVEHFKKLTKQVEARLAELTQGIYDGAGEKFNINSTKELQEVFRKLKFPVVKKTKGGNPSTDADALEELAKTHELPKLLLEYRELMKLKTTYLETLPKRADPTTSRIHTSFSQASVSTGRLSSSNPNLQNIPKKGCLGSEVRKAFVARKGYKILAADYSQMELRVLAHYSADRNLVSAFKNGEDIHKQTAARVFKIPLGKVTKEQRSVAKTSIYGIIYSIGPEGLARRTGLTKAKGKKFIGDFFMQYPKVKVYIDTMRDFAKQNGFVTTLFHRRRYLPKIYSENFQEKSSGERQAQNTPIQGTAADIMKIAMIAIYKKLKPLKSSMILQVHDEILVEVYEPELKHVTQIIKDCMEQAVSLKVPLVVDIGVGDNWFDAKNNGEDKNILDDGKIYFDGEAKV